MVKGRFDRVSKIYHLDQDLRLFFITFAQKHLLNAQADISCGARSKVWTD